MKLRQLQNRKVRLIYEKMKLEEECPIESVGQKGRGSSQQQRVSKSKKRNLEVEKIKNIMSLQQRNKIELCQGRA